MQNSSFDPDLVVDGEGETRLDMSFETSALTAYRTRAYNTNVNDVTLLATDYLNHFNEALMLAELAVDMPDMLDDLIYWSPVSYIDHFRDSGIADRELAIEAYGFSPEEYKVPFEAVTKQLNSEIKDLQTTFGYIGRLEDQEIRAVAVHQCTIIRELIEQAGAIINGHVGDLKSPALLSKGAVGEGIFDQEDINAMFD